MAYSIWLGYMEALLLKPEPRCYPKLKPLVVKQLKISMN